MKYYPYILIIIATSIIHELSHAIVGGYNGFVYAPWRDPLSTAILLKKVTVYSAAAGFLSTIPFIFIKGYGVFTFFFTLFQSRWDIVDIFSGNYE